MRKVARLYLHVHHNLELASFLRGLLLLLLGGQRLDERHLGLVADPHSDFVLLDEEAHMEHVLDRLPKVVGMEDKLEEVDGPPLIFFKLLHQSLVNIQNDFIRDVFRGLGLLQSLGLSLLQLRHLGGLPRLLLLVGLLLLLGRWRDGAEGSVHGGGEVGGPSEQHLGLLSCSKEAHNQILSQNGD